MITGAMKPRISPEHRMWAERMKSLREAYAWNQVKAAEELGISQGQVANIENGRYLPNQTLQKLIDCKLSKAKK